ncbi:hypothetical protein ASE78_11405 [Sphingomonas sp. Leaf25]|nr:MULTISPECIES: hypothetical protein [unclassified Sphingomonas]KQM96918.1 hypothetical protein ASE78_11405 [Sphingomonas sp. Leaf25]
MPVFSTPAAAQVQNGTLVIYGNDKCPTNTNGEEIVVCVRRSEQERFRIPKELRELEVTPENESWAMRAEANQNVGATGTGSCSTVGPGGQTGCFVQRANAARAERRARRDAETNIPLP